MIKHTTVVQTHTHTHTHTRHTEANSVTSQIILNSEVPPEAATELVRRQSRQVGRQRVVRGRPAALKPPPPHLSAAPRHVEQVVHDC